MQPDDKGPTGSDPAQPAPNCFRFRTHAEPGGRPTQRVWNAIYAHEDGWARFKIVLDLSGNTCTFIRSADDNYAVLMEILSGKQAGSQTPIPKPTLKHESVTYDIQVMGLKLTRLAAGNYKTGPGGDWLVAQVFLPRSVESFLLAMNDRSASGEIAIAEAKSVRPVLQALAEVFY